MKPSVRYTRILKSLTTVPHHEVQHQSPLTFLSSYLKKWNTDAQLSSENSKLSSVPSVGGVKEATSSNGVVSVKMNYDGQLVDVRLIKNKIPSIENLQKKDLELWIQEACNSAWLQFSEEGRKAIAFQEEHQWVFEDQNQL